MLLPKGGPVHCHKSLTADWALCTASVRAGADARTTMVLLVQVQVQLACAGCVCLCVHALTFWPTIWPTIQARLCRDVSAHTAGRRASRSGVGVDNLWECSLH